MRARGFFGPQRQFKRVLDLGCGTGILGIILAKNSRVDELDLLDIEAGARLTASTNALINFRANDDYRTQVFTDDTEVIRTDECLIRFIGEDFRSRILRCASRAPLYDLTICTPPYVPFMRDLRDPSMWRAVAGTDLLRAVLLSWRSFTRQLLIQFSEIALPEVEGLLDGGDLMGIHTVAFRIPPLQRFFSPKENEYTARGRTWLERVRPYMVDTERTDDVAVAQHHHGFKFFHRLRTYLFS